MPAERKQARVFGEVAELYDKARRGYSEEVIDAILAFAGVDAQDLRALEIGAGTGKATAALAAKGVNVLALEPDAAITAVAQRNCDGFPGVRVEPSTFEGWRPGPERYGLVFSAQAWHWVSPEVRWVKAAGVLVPAGALALFWHRTDWHGEQLRDELDDIYRRVAPALHARDPGFPFGALSLDNPWSEEMGATELFGEVVVRAYPWSARFSADAFMELLLTQSDHRLAGDDERRPLFDALRELIARHGGEVVVPLATVLVLTRRRGDSDGDEAPQPTTRASRSRWPIGG